MATSVAIATPVVDASRRRERRLRRRPHGLSTRILRQCCRGPDSDAGGCSCAVGGHRLDADRRATGPHVTTCAPTCIARERRRPAPEPPTGGRDRPWCRYRPRLEHADVVARPVARVVQDVAEIDRGDCLRTRPGRRRSCRRRPCSSRRRRWCTTTTRRALAGRGGCCCVGQCAGRRRPVAAREDLTGHQIQAGTDDGGGQHGSAERGHAYCISPAHDSGRVAAVRTGRAPDGASARPRPADRVRERTGGRAAVVRSAGRRAAGARGGLH